MQREGDPARGGSLARRGGEGRRGDRRRDTPLRALIDARLKHTGPFVIREGEAVSGLIRDEDLFRCLKARAEGSAPTPL